MPALRASPLAAAAFVGLEAVLLTVVSGVTALFLVVGAAAEVVDVYLAAYSMCAFALLVCGWEALLAWLAPRGDVAAADAAATAHLVADADSG